jgi:hypothetical protein
MELFSAFQNDHLNMQPKSQICTVKETASLRFEAYKIVKPNLITIYVELCMTVSQQILMIKKQQ